MAKSTVNRSLYYYDLYAVYEDEESKQYKHSREKIKRFFVDLYEEQKNAEDYASFLKKNRNRDDFFVIVDTVADDYIQFRIVLCRTDALPFIEKNGKLDSLGTYIDADQNIAEVTHCVYFVNYGIMGGEYNFSGARPTSISDYILSYGIDAILVTCRAKLNYDAYSKLIAGEQFSLFDFAVKTNSDAYTKVLSQKSIFSVIQATVPETDTFEIVLRKRKTKKNKYSGFTAPLTEEEIKLLLENHREDIERFSVSQASFNDKIDLLSDKLVHKISMVRTDDRIINSDDMYKEIRNYFNSTVVNYCKAE